MAEPRSALFLSAWRIQELVVLCLVLVSSTDGRKRQGKEGYRKQPRRFTCILLTKKSLERKGKITLFYIRIGAKRTIFILLSSKFLEKYNLTGNTRV